MSSCNESAKNNYGKHAEDHKKPMLDRMRDSELYIASDPTVQAEMERTESWLSRFNASLALPIKERNKILRQRIGGIGENTTIRPPFFCDYGSNLYLGSNVYFNYNCCVLDVCRVDIGDNTQIGPAVQIYAADHPREQKLRDAGWEFGKPVWIGRNVWIGGGAIILPGVRIGDHAIVGAGSIVTRDVPDNTTVVGNPARPLVAKNN